MDRGFHQSIWPISGHRYFSYPFHKCSTDASWLLHIKSKKGYSSSCSLPDFYQLQIAWYVNLRTCGGLMRLWFPCGTQKFLLFKEMLGDIDASGGGGLGGGLFGPKAPRNKYNLWSFDTKACVTDQEMCFFRHCNMQTDSVINKVTVKEGRKSWRAELKREDMWTTWIEFFPPMLCSSYL